MHSSRTSEVASCPKLSVRNLKSTTGLGTRGKMCSMPQVESKVRVSVQNGGLPRVQFLRRKGWPEFSQNALVRRGIPPPPASTFARSPMRSTGSQSSGCRKSLRSEAGSPQGASRPKPTKPTKPTASTPSTTTQKIWSLKSQVHQIYGWNVCCACVARQPNLVAPIPGKAQCLWTSVSLAAA